MILALPCTFHYSIIMKRIFFFSPTVALSCVPQSNKIPCSIGIATSILHVSLLPLGWFGSILAILVEKYFLP